MKIFYVDIYFLINFTVDILSVYLASRLASVRLSAARLILSGAVGAVLACVVVLFDIKGCFFVLMLMLSGILTVLAAQGYRGTLLFFKVLCGFIIAETVLGGFVTLVYNLLDKYLAPELSENELGTKNRGILLLALIVLTAYFIIRLVLMLFSGRTHEKTVTLAISLDGKKITLTGLIDSGNLLRDPFSSSPVVVAKYSALQSFLGIKKLEQICSDERYKARIRMIPSKTVGTESLLYGLRSDSITVGNKEIANAIIALDSQDGSFGGFGALVPSTLLEV